LASHLLQQFAHTDNLPSEQQSTATKYYLRENLIADIDRELTAGEMALLKSIFANTIEYAKVKVHNYKAYFFQPDDTAMTPDGEIYFPIKYYQEDFSTASLSDRA